MERKLERACSERKWSHAMSNEECVPHVGFVVCFYCITVKGFVAHFTSSLSLAFCMSIHLTYCVHATGLTRELFFKGTSRPFSMVVLKKGSSNIFVKKTGATWNWIGKCYL